MQVQLKDGVMSMRSLRHIPSGRGAKGLISNMFRGIQPFEKGLGLTFSRFLYVYHKKSMFI